MNPIKRYLIAVKTKGGYFYSPYRVDENNRAERMCDFARGYLINGETPEPSWTDGWYFSKTKPVKMEQPQSPEYINYRFELKNPEMASDKIPAKLLKDEAVMLIEGSSWETRWRPELAHLVSLYDEKSDKVDRPPLDLPFELNILMEMDALQPPQNFEYSTGTEYNTWNYKHEEKSATNKSLEVCLLDQLTFPAIMHHTRPCRLSSVEVYKVLRQAIIKGINPEVARITINYDFCFNVAKLVPLPKPEHYKSCTNPFSRGRKHYFDWVQTHKELPFFQMTHDKSNYENYTPIDPLIGKDADDLKVKLDSLIGETLRAINKPIKLCEHCGGLGYKSSYPASPTNRRKE